MSRRSTTVFLVPVLLAGLAGCAPKPAAPATPAEDLAALDAKLRAEALVWFDHFAKADADGMANLYAPDAVLMPPGAPAVTGREGIRAFLGEEATKAKAAGLTLRNKEVTGSGVSGELGWISGLYEVVDVSGNAVDGGHYLSVHRHVGGSWPYIRDTWNSDRPAAHAPANP